MDRCRQYKRSAVIPFLVDWYGAEEVLARNCCLCLRVLLFRFWRLPIFTGRCLWNVFFRNAGQNHQPIAEAYVLVPVLHGIGQIPIDKNPGGVTL